MEFYRYEARSYAAVDHDGDLVRPAFPDVRLTLMTFNLHRETPKGYWIGYGHPDGFNSPSKWVSKTARKRYAYPTKEQALENYVKRTERRVKILKAQLHRVEIGLDRAIQLQKIEV